MCLSPSGLGHAAGLCGLISESLLGKGNHRGRAWAVGLMMAGGVLSRAAEIEGPFGITNHALK